MGKGLVDGYLAGHDDVTHTDEGVMDYLLGRFDISSMLDIGCGPGGMIDVAISKGLEVQGVDGDYTLPDRPERIIHDFTKGPCENLETYDLAWSVEFVEHVHQQYIPNFMAAFERCKYVVMTAAPPGTPGNHHVNCQEKEYWIDVFKQYGFKYNVYVAEDVRSKSSMGRNFMRDNGLFFEK